MLPLVAWGLVQAGLGAVIERIAQSLHARRPRLALDSLSTGLWALLASPYIAWVCSQLFAGSRAQRLPGRHALSLVLFVLFVVALWRALRMLRTHLAAVRDKPLQAAVSATGLFGFVILFHGADRLILPRLYPFFHLTLALLEVALTVAAIELIKSGRGGPAQPSRRRDGILLAAVALLAVCSGHAFVKLHRATVLRGLVLEKTTLGAQLLRRYAAVRARSSSGRAQLPVSLGETEPPPEYTGPRLAGRDVFLITVDALRHDRLAPQYMPQMDALSRRGVIMSRAYTQVPHTSFAVATMLTGKPVYALLELGHDAASHETLPLVLRRFRYKTAAFYPPAVFFIERERLKKLEESAYGFEYVKYEYMAAPGRTDQVITFLETEKPERTFVWVHYFEPHEPYDPHALAEGGTTARSSDVERYDGEVRFVDREVGRLVTYLSRTRPGALIVLAADHGEEFGEHGGRYHGTTLYEEQVRVPLFLSELSPTPLLRARTLGQPVGLIDLAPTLLGLLDIERSARMRGRDLSPWLLSGADALPSDPVFAEIGRQKMVVLGEQKLICDLAIDTCQSFDLKNDPAERNNTIDSAPAEAQKLRARLDAYLGESRRYESNSPQDNEPDAAALSRARLGDRAALPQLITLLAKEGGDAAMRRQALALFAELVATAPAKKLESLDAALQAPATAALLKKLFESSRAAAKAGDANATIDARWAAVANVQLFGRYLGPEDAPSQAVEALILDDSATARQRLAGALAIAMLPGCVPPAAPGPIDCAGLWITALPSTMSLEDPDAARPLLELLGRSRDARARLPLTDALEGVRTRADVTAALGALGERAAVPTLARLLEQDPYVNVRVAAAKALGSVGGERARAALSTALQKEAEQPVKNAISAALLAKTPPR